MMHIAHFIQRYPPSLGGSEAYFERLTKYNEQQGDQVTVWTTTAIDLEAFWHSGHQEIEASCLKTKRTYSPLRFPLRRYILKACSLLPIPQWQAATLPCNPVCPTMWRDVKQYVGPVDAVHATAFPYAFPILCAWKLAKRRNVPFLLTPFLHLGDHKNPNDQTKKQYTQRPLRWLLNQADRIFVQTRLEADAVHECGVSCEKIILQGLGVNPEECTDGKRVTYCNENNPFIIGHLANKSVEKGTVDLLKAVQILADKKLNFHVVLAGADMHNFREFWQSFPDRYRKYVISLDRLDDSAKRDFFASIDLFCLPSRSDSFGLVLLEAWANQKANVVYNAGGPAEIVRNKLDGLVSDCNPTALANCLEEMIQNRDRCVQYGKAGQERIQKEFRWEDKLKLVRDTLVDSAERKFSLSRNK